ELDLLPPEWEVLAMIDGTRDLRAISTELGRSDFDVAKTVFGLESAGVVVLLDMGAVRRERGTSAAQLAEVVARAEDALARRDVAQARAEADHAATLAPQDASVQLLLGRLYNVEGRATEAVDALRRALRFDPLLAPAHRALGYALVST